jgi:hypothetical protein
MGWLLFMLNLEDAGVEVIVYRSGGVFAAPGMVRTSVTSSVVSRTSTSGTDLVRTSVTSVGLEN